MPLVSIIVPVYNAREYIEKCIDSILMQSFDDFELIVVDDGSSDGSGEICDIYAKRDGRIKVIHKKNEGLVRARKDGFYISAGRYIAFVDADDWIEPDMMNSLYSKMVEENVDIVMCGRFEDTGTTQRKVYHGIREGRYSKQEMLDKVYPNMVANGAFFEWGIFPGLWDKLCKRECIEKFLLRVNEGITMGEDAACIYPCLLQAESIYILRECLYHYRQSTSSMVKKNEDTMLERERFRVLYKSVDEELEKQKHIYDLRSQWKDYVLFLMVPRAGYLYEGIGELDYLFPFPGVKKGSNIIIYGMGTYGQLLYNYLKETGFCNVIAAVDKNYIELQKQGIDVCSPDEIKKYEYDAIVIANSFARTRMEIYQYLIAKYPKKKVHVMDEALIKSRETMEAFGLI